jgi:hypothetical protein
VQAKAGSPTPATEPAPAEQATTTDDARPAEGDSPALQPTPTTFRDRGAFGAGIAVSATGAASLIVALGLVLTYEGQKLNESLDTWGCAPSLADCPGRKITHPNPDLLLPAAGTAVAGVFLASVGVPMIVYGAKRVPASDRSMHISNFGPRVVAVDKRGGLLTFGFDW